MNLFKICIRFLLLVALFSCSQVSDPKDDQPRWENITYNLEGEIIYNFLVHKNDLYVSTEKSIYRLFNQSWKFVTSTTQNISDFNFKNDTLVVLSGNGKVFFLNDNNSLIEKYNANMDILSSHKMVINDDEIFVGSTGQLGGNPGWEHLQHGLAKMSNEENRYYPMENFNTQYSVHRMLKVNNSIYVGSIITTGYFVGLYEDNRLLPIGLDTNLDPYGHGCYSLIEFKETLMVGTEGKILQYKNTRWEIYKELLPTIQNTSLVDKAISLCTADNEIIVGTIHNGILKYNYEELVWENITSENLPSGNSINALKNNNDYLYSLLGNFESFEKPKSEFIYKLKITTN